MLCQSMGVAFIGSPTVDSRQFTHCCQFAPYKSRDRDNGLADHQQSLT